MNLHGLFWKEWRESRLTVLWIALLAIGLYIGDVALTALNSGDQPLAVYSGNAKSVLVALMFLSAGLSGSSMLSPEIGDGTLQFLSSLPICRQRIWRTKLFTSLFVHLISMAYALTVFAVANYLLHALGWMPDSLRTSLIDLSANFWFVVPLTLGVFAVATVMTTLFDRTLSSFMVTALISIAAGSLLVSIIQLGDLHNVYLIGWLWLLFGVVGLSLLTLSYEVFLHGETLRTKRRFTVAAWAAFGDDATIAAAILLAVLWLLA